MGSFGAGLASVGSSIAEARDLQRQQKLEDIKNALEQKRIEMEQQQLGLTGTYANIAGIREKREQAEFEERKRLALQPKFIGARVVGGRLYSGVQDPKDGTIKFTEVTGADTSKDAQALEEEINGLPEEARDSAQRLVSPYVLAGDYAAARGALKPTLQKYIETQFPGQVELTKTTETHELDTAKGRKLVQVPKITTKQKVPAKGTSGIGGTTGGVARGRTGEAPPAPLSPSQIAKNLGLPAGSKVIGTKPPSRAEISKVIDPIGDADRRYKVMLDAAAHPNAQNDVAMLFNHIGMTLSAQRGARITSAEIERAIAARSVPEDLLALLTKVKNGQFLTPDQRKNMLALGKLNRDFIWQQAWEKAKSEAMAQYLPRTLPGLPPVTGIHYVGEDIKLNNGGKARVVEVNPDGSIEVKPY
jgi:hypothetical protein